jgi:hypothetical protein
VYWKDRKVIVDAELDEWKFPFENMCRKNHLCEFAFEREHFAINLFDTKWSNFSNYRLLRSLPYFELWLIDE